MDRRVGKPNRTASLSSLTAHPTLDKLGGSRADQVGQVLYESKTIVLVAFSDGAIVVRELLQAIK